MQPETFLSGVRECVRCTSRGLFSARDVARRMYTSNTVGVEVVQVMGQLLPVLLLRPLLGLTEGISRAMQVGV